MIRWCCKWPSIMETDWDELMDVSNSGAKFFIQWNIANHFFFGKHNLQLVFQILATADENGLQNYTLSFTPAREEESWLREILLLAFGQQTLLENFVVGHWQTSYSQEFINFLSTVTFYSFYFQYKRRRNTQWLNISNQKICKEEMSQCCRYHH